MSLELSGFLNKRTFDEIFNGRNLNLESVKRFLERKNYRDPKTKTKYIGKKVISIYFYLQNDKYLLQISRGKLIFGSKKYYIYKEEQ